MAEAMLPPVLQRIKSLGMEVFTNGDWNLNFFGIRSPDQVSGVYDDLMGCAYKVKGQWHVRYWAATSDPGVYYRENPITVRGTGILIPGQYKGAYSIGKHRGYEALVQTGPVRLWRDSNKDEILDYSGEDVDEAEGYFGINLHASSSHPYDETRDRDPETSQVGKWSAGCQVHATTTGFLEMMDLAKRQIKEHPTWSPKFTYTLLESW